METCPWSGWAPATIQFCEKPICAWITQPANTWSNLFFIIAGWFIWQAARKNQRSDLLIVGGSAVFLGFASGLFHASGTFFFEFFDLAGMFLISSMMVTLNARRWLRLSNSAVIAMFLALTLSGMGIMLIERWAGIPIFGTHIAMALTIELIVHLRGDRVLYKDMFYMVGSFAAAFSFWIGDITGRLCDPGNHFISGHGVWHTLNALAILFLYRFYRQFELFSKSDATQSKIETGG